MPASDQTFYNQHKLDIVFGLSSILMLVSVVIMFTQDYFRPFKEEQRVFRDVESCLAQRLALAAIPSAQEFAEKEQAVKNAREKRDKKDKEIGEIKREMARIQPQKELSETAFGNVAANLDSKISFFNSHAGQFGIQAANEKYRAEIDSLTAEKARTKAVFDDHVEKLLALQRSLNDIEGPLLKAQAEWKNLNDRFEAQAKLAISKQWRWTDSLRAFPVMDAFNSPLKIHQLTIEDIPIDYNFKHVTRFDSCTTCHLGIDRPAYTKKMLQSLTSITPEQKNELEAARERLKQRKLTLASLENKGESRRVPDADSLTLTTLSEKELTPARLKEFSAHPRLELFVGASSKHPAEKFGCSSCHQGQGRGTTFTAAFHSPNDSKAMEEWKKSHGWDPTDHTFLWDFPMHPTRFIESSCLKCHHQVTDLYGADNRNEAPKLLRGYNLIKENGCFGCHEIQGRKGGRQVGPDLRLESRPALDELSPIERARIEEDPDSMPGNLRKVGPSLYRLADKTNRDWTAKFIKTPRAFRPDTKMPHFFDLANSNAAALAGTGQESFPDAEIQAIAHYLIKASEDRLKSPPLEDRVLTKREEKTKRLNELQKLAKPSDQEKAELAEVGNEIERLKSPRPDVGRQLFSERGCLACHSHVGTEKPQGSSMDANFVPRMISEAQFGPNLSQLSAKLGQSPGDKESPRKWLVQMILDPHVHSPRSRMPVTHVTVEQAADIAAWLLSQPAQGIGEGWKNISFTEPTEETLKSLAKVYLKRMLPDNYIDEILANQWKGTNDVRKKNTIRDLPQDEVNLAAVTTGNSLMVKEITVPDLKLYLGKKAINRLGCFACHDIPGFDTAKGIGPALTDWGKKDPERLAFEDIDRYLDEHYHSYEAFFAASVKLRKREGYLHQKLVEPRSYDYNRLLAWDDRARMPQFRFARSHKKTAGPRRTNETGEQYEARKKIENETDTQFEDRMVLEEAEAREAVMTFILGLVAEPVPLKSINRPSDDRLAVVKGRQVIDKFNCAGCHLVQPGVFDFNVGNLTGKFLDRAYHQSMGKEHSFPAHSGWTGKTSTLSGPLAAQGTLNPRQLFQYFDPESLRVITEDLTDAANIKTVKVRLSRALRFANSTGDQDILASSSINIVPGDMIYPPPESLGSEETFQKFMRDRGPLGGTFNNLLMDYLIAKYKFRANANFARDEITQENNNARASGPPSLIGQGERTQSAWLKQFLLDPQSIRPMAVLRMPRFNMSPGEAQTLVDYFDATARLANPGIEIDQGVPQEDSFDKPAWTVKNIQYLDRLGAEGKEKRRQELQPYFESNLDGFVTVAKRRAESARIDLDKYKMALEGEKDEKKQDELRDKINGAQQLIEAAKQVELSVPGVSESRAWKTWVLENDEYTPKERERDWEKQAYIADSYKIMANVCVKCHQVGNLAPNNKITSGPPLSNAHKRLRPGWVEHWVASPQRFLPYDSVMPVSFPVNTKDFQHLLAGSSLDQVLGVRDAVMALPRLESLPINRFRQLTLPLDLPP